MAMDVNGYIKMATGAEDSNEIIQCLRECLKQAEDINGFQFKVNNDDVSNLISILDKTEVVNDAIICVLQLVADLAKLEGNRPVFTNKTLMMKLIGFLLSDSPDICMQSIRSLANICADNEAACNLFMECGGVKQILGKAESILTSEDNLWIPVIPNACACIRNMVINDETLQEDFLRNNALAIFWQYVEKYHETDMNIATLAISGIEALSDSESSLQILESSNILTDMCSLMTTFNDNMLQTILKELILEFGRKENTAELLCRCGYVEAFCDMIEKRRNFRETKCEDELMKEMADLVVLLSAEGFVMLHEKEKNFLNRISDWIESPNPHVQVSGGLILGNYARSEETCKEIIDTKIHENLINVMKEHLQDEAYFDRFQSYASCLRNLTIPAQNKTILVEAGLHLLAVQLVKIPSLGVQFKGLGIIRLLIQGNTEITSALLLDSELISKICELSGMSSVSSVSSEAQRLMTALFKYNNSDGPIRHAMSIGGLKAIVPLLSSDHVTMVNEGLVGIIIGIANVNDCLPYLEENEILSKIIKRMSDHLGQTQTIFNCITVLQAFSSLDGGIDRLKSHHVLEILQVLKSHNEEIIRNKVAEMILILN